MSAQPSVVIVGRPNVGKSTLFNAILRSRRSIVGDEPGITRDRIYGQAEYRARKFDLIDTGGIIQGDGVSPAIGGSNDQLTFSLFTSSDGIEGLLNQGHGGPIDALR